MNGTAALLRREMPMWPGALAPFAVAILGPLLPLLILFAGTLPPSAPHPSPALALALAALTVAALAVSLAWLGLRGVRAFPATLWAPLAALMSAQALALGWSVAPKAGIFSLVATLAGYVVLICTCEVLRHDRTRRAFLACYLVSAAVAALGAAVLSVMRLPPAMYAYEHGRASGTFLQPNELAGYLLFVIPLGLAQIAAPKWLRATGLATAAAGALGLLLSVSRAGIASLVIGLLFFIRRFSRRALAAYLICACIGLALLATVFRNIAHDPSENASRLAVWGGAARIAQRFALTGVGPLGFHLVYPRFKLPEASANEVHAHSLPLQILVEDGVLGLFAGVWLVAAAVAASVRARRTIDPRDRERGLLFAALACGFVASGLQNAIDVVTTFLLIAVWPMLGLTLALGQKQRGDS